MNPSQLRALQLIFLNNKADFLPVFRRDFLTILGTFRRLAEDPDHAQAAQILAWWKSVAQAAGVSEQELRMEDTKEARQCFGKDRFGCSWFKCARYGRECDTATLYRCSGCEKSMYCGSLCQTRCAISTDMFDYP